MASIQQIETKLTKAKAMHERTAKRLAAIKERFEKEKKILQAHQEEIYSEWMRNFTILAEKENIQVCQIDAERLLALILANKDAVLLVPEEKDEKAKDGEVEFA